MVNDVNRSRSEIDNINSNHYNGTDISRALAHWALKCLLADIEPSDADLVRATAIGGPRDLDFDAYWIDDINSRLILVQAKDTERMNRNQRLSDGVAEAFRASIETLADEDYVRSNANVVLKEAFDEYISDAIYDETYSIYAVIAAGGHVSQRSRAREYCEGPGSLSWDLFDENNLLSKEVQMRLFDIEEMSDEARRLRLGGATDYVLPVVATERGPAFHYMGGTTRSAVATVYAESLAEAYRKYRSDIFRYNPRGPQASNKVNGQILSALKDPIWKQMFHILNNGITIVCETIQFDEQDREIEIKNLQIVNGCQTVYTLFRAKNELTDDVTVNIRVVERMQSVAAQIAKASNSQTAVKAEQLASLDPVHDTIKLILDQHNPPWYYEKQLGSVRFLSEADKRTHRLRYGSNQSRTVSIVELGRAGIAFLGHPIVAKHSRQIVFERTTATWAAVYAAIFNGSNSADQLLLPVEIRRRVDASVSARAATLRALQPNQPSETTATTTELDWIFSAKFHIVGLIGAAIRDKEQVTLFPSTQQSQVLLNTIEDWFETAFNDACDAIHFYVRVATNTANRVFNIRQFFRNEERYEEMVTEMKRLTSRHTQ